MPLTLLASQASSQVSGSQSLNLFEKFQELDLGRKLVKIGLSSIEII